jgi:NADH:ubiquinone oxidoreductase subunit C
MEIRNPEHVLIEIEPDSLLAHVMTLKNQGRRLSQICCAYSNEKIELSYSFADDDTNEYINLRLVIEKDTEVCSITEFYPYAFLYENEMKELFGVNIQMINLDYNNKLYRINEEAPFLK